MKCVQILYETDYDTNNINQGEAMTIHKNDLEELRRMATNTYDNDKKFLNRVIMGIGVMESELRKLKEENDDLKKKVKVANENRQDETES